MPQEKKTKKQLERRSTRHFREQTRPPLIGEGAYYAENGSVRQIKHSEFCKNTTTMNCAVCKVPVCDSCGFRCLAHFCFNHFCDAHKEYTYNSTCPHTAFPDQPSKNEAAPKIENSSQLSLLSHSAMNHEDSHDLQLKKTKPEEVKTKLRREEDDDDNDEQIRHPLIGEDGVFYRVPHQFFRYYINKNEVAPTIENSSQLSLSSHSAMNHEDEKLEDSHDLQLKKTKTEKSRRAKVNKRISVDCLLIVQWNMIRITITIQFTLIAQCCAISIS